MRKFIIYIKANILLSIAIRKAEKLHNKYNLQYYVTANSDHSLIILSRKAFKRIKQRDLIDRKATLPDLARECFYRTENIYHEDRLSQNEIKRKRLVWIVYCYKFWR